MEFVPFWCRKIEARWKDVDEDENPEDQNRSEAGSEDFNYFDCWRKPRVVVNVGGLI